MTGLGTLGGTRSTAYGINSAGTTVGSSYPTGSTIQHAFSYSGWQMADLGTLGGLDSCAYGINDAGTIVGESSPSDYDEHAFSYSGGQMTDLGTLGGGITSVAYGINNAGTIVGESYLNGYSMYHAFSDSGGIMTDLAPYLASIGLTGNSEAWAINDNGDIVGDGMTADGRDHAFLLAVVPEPSTVALLALGGAALLLPRRSAF
jgi:probable HAF family extracellular repeat protein